MKMMNKLLVSLVALNLGMVSCKDIVVKVNKKGGSSQLNTSAMIDQNAGEADAIVNTYFNKLDDTKKKIAESLLDELLKKNDLRSTVRDALRDVRDAAIAYSQEHHDYKQDFMTKINALNELGLDQCKKLNNSKEMHQFFKLMKNNDSLSTMLEAAFLAKVKNFDDLKIDGQVKVKDSQKNLDDIAQAFALAEFGITLDGSSSVKREADGSIRMSANGVWKINEDAKLDKGKVDANKDYATKIVFDYLTKPTGEKKLIISVEVQKGSMVGDKMVYAEPNAVEKSYKLNLELDRVSHLDAEGHTLNTITAHVMYGTNLGHAYEDRSYDRELKWDQVKLKLYRFTLKDGDDNTPRVVDLDVGQLQYCAEGALKDLPKGDGGKGDKGGDKCSKGDDCNTPKPTPTPTPTVVPSVTPSTTPTTTPTTTPSTTPTPDPKDPKGDDDYKQDDKGPGQGPTQGPSQNQNQNQNK